MISIEMISAYLEIIEGASPTIKRCAHFASDVARRPLTYDLLTLSGRPHSAQDISRFLQEGLPTDIVLAKIKGGQEVFVLGRSDDTPNAVDPVQLGRVYFGVESRYASLPAPWRQRLAVIASCREFEIRFGYEVWFKDL